MSLPEIKHHNLNKWSDPYISFYHVFKEEIRSNADIKVNYQELERLNPVDTISVSNIPSDIATLFNALNIRIFWIDRTIRSVSGVVALGIIGLSLTFWPDLVIDAAKGVALALLGYAALG